MAVKRLPASERANSLLSPTAGMIHSFIFSIHFILFFMDLFIYLLIYVIGCVSIMGKLSRHSKRHHRK
ncbi:MAG: hypothetical protein LUF85_03565 [Bacteroides sp.]|nr:hypothetical protein [Bacteroides sp.]